MSAWYLAALTLLAAFLAATIATLTGDLMRRLVAFEMAAVLGILELTVLAEAIGSGFLFDVALTAAFLSLPSGLLLNRFYARWL